MPARLSRPGRDPGDAHRRGVALGGLLTLLDDPDALGAGDAGRALGAVASLPDQVRAADEALADLPTEGLPSAEGVSSVLLCGMGGSGVGGAAVAAAARETGRVPMLAQRGYGAPAWCGPATLVVTSSYSGDTEETLDAFRGAARAGARGVAVVSGGGLAAEAADAGWATVPVDAGLMPRYAVGWMTCVPALLLERIGLLELPPGWAARTAELLDERAEAIGPGMPLRENPAKLLAETLVGALPVVWGGDGIGEVAAVRWACDLNENAKTPAHAAALPEADHNEIVGWAPEGADGRPVGRRVLVCLRAPGREDPRVAARFGVTLEEVRASFDVVTEVETRGDDPLARFLDLALFSGFVSVYLAVLRGVEAVPIPSIARLKEALG